MESAKLEYAINNKEFLYDFFAKREQDKSLTGFLHNIPSPCYVLYKPALASNLMTLMQIAYSSGSQILVALKGYSFWREFDIVSDCLDGATCSGLWEARLAQEEVVNNGLKTKLILPNDMKQYFAMHGFHGMKIDISFKNLKKNENPIEYLSKKIKPESNENLIEYLSKKITSKKHICVFSPAYKQSQMIEIVKSLRI